MGTNFYVRGWKSRDSMDPKYHIGKRSAAGLFCWDCGVTLCKGGPTGVHHEYPWFTACLLCGQKQSEEGWESSAGRELGFAKYPPGKKAGVKSCCSFTWCMDPDKFLKKRVTIWNEYGDNFSHDEFLKILEECPIQFKESIGQWFS